MPACELCSRWQAFFLKANKDGSSLHSHLTELVHSLLQSKDPKALEKLESISLAVKAKHFTAAEEGVKVFQLCFVCHPAATPARTLFWFR